uniref:Uncharacterized protein n=1 Tax=Candidatus Kentrum sp. TC TaxID=2126339 RepID=A0A450ZSH0_9GAMM|nr:MAG: hypothetical protein BECKTC1821F_GA0114240_101210 [Candidatus Kentron sp. TC]
MDFRGVESGFPHLLRPRKVKQNIPFMLQSDMTLKFWFTFCVINKNNNAHNQSLQRTANAATELGREPQKIQEMNHANRAD